MVAQIHSDRLILSKEDHIKSVANLIKLTLK